MNTPFKWENFDHFYNTAKKRSIDQVGSEFNSEELKVICDLLFTISSQLDAEKYMNPTGFMISRIKKTTNKIEYAKMIGEYKWKLNKDNIEKFKESLLRKEDQTAGKTEKKENKKEDKSPQKIIPYKEKSASKKVNDTVLKFDGSIPKKPGVYFLFDDDKKLIYIGRSICLSNRVPGSFIERKAKYVKVMITETKADAYIMEPYCILTYNPPSNSEFKTGDRPTFCLNLPPISDFIQPILAPRLR